MKQFVLALCLTFFAVVAQAQDAKSVATPVKENVSTVIQDTTPAPSSVVQEKKPVVQPAPSVITQPPQEVKAAPGVIQSPVASGTVVSGSSTGCCPPVINPCCCQPQRGRLFSRFRGRFGVRRWR